MSQQSITYFGTFLLSWKSTHISSCVETGINKTATLKKRSDYFMVTQLYSVYTIVTMPCVLMFATMVSMASITLGKHFSSNNLSESSFRQWENLL